LGVIFTAFKPLGYHVVVETVQSLKSHYHNTTLHKEEFYKNGLNSITIRFELWKVAFELAKNNMLYGVSRARIIEYIDDMILNREVHPGLREYDQPHNAYLYYLVSRGVIGAGLFLLVLLIPLMIFLRQRKNRSTQATSGMIFVLFFGFISLTQSSVFARGHYLSFFLIVLIILLSGMSASKGKIS
jgi:O-antigen ligase